MTQETFQFQAEINQLLSLIINTFYSNKDVFLRELISNSSDAIDKAKHIALSSGENKAIDYNIEMIADKENKTLSIRDNGIGMTKDDMISCLGTIANSGTKQFMEALQSGADLSLIGQFGVGFYSAYLVADTVHVYSKHKDSPKMYCWESKAGGSFTITELDECKFDVGTEIVLSMKEESTTYLEQSKLEEIVKTHSEYITYPIKLWTTRSESKEVPDDEEETENVENKENETVNEEGKIETVDENETVEEKPKKTKTVVEEIEEWKHLNTKKPIWQRKPEDVSEEEHGAFYKSLTNDWDTHLTVKHFIAEGQIEYKSLLYIPKRTPFVMFRNAVKKNNITGFHYGQI